MFYYFNVTESITGETVCHIMQPLEDGGVRSFPLIGENPHTVAYLAWVAEGNTAEEWTGN